MGGTKQTTTSNSAMSLNERVSTAARGSDEQELLQMMQQYLGSALGSSTLGGLAGGGSPVVSDEIRNLVSGIVDPQAASARAAVGADYQKAGMALSGALEGAGLGGSSIEAVRRAVLGGEQARSLADIERSRISTYSNLAAQLGQQQTQNKLSANQILMQQILGLSGSLSENYLRDRLANTTSTRNVKERGTNTTEQSSDLFSLLLAGGLDKIPGGSD